MELIGLEVGSVRKEPNIYRIGRMEQTKNVANSEIKEINCSKAVMCRILDVERVDINTKVMCVM